MTASALYYDAAFIVHSTVCATSAGNADTAQCHVPQHHPDLHVGSPREAGERFWRPVLPLPPAQEPELHPPNSPGVFAPCLQHSSTTVLFQDSHTPIRSLVYRDMEEMGGSSGTT